jgi:uncharacterized protein
MSTINSNTGIYGFEEEALRKVVTRLIDALDPQAIWLFGSRARGNNRADSDFDLLIVAKPNGTFGSDDYIKALRPTFGTGLDCEVVPCSWQDFEDAKMLHTTLIAQVIDHGRLLYGARS